ncbi:MAG: hypothetical protein GY820_31765 [Gammaproteobacteria bacterium]|nr:hypothetical protein [Gammaproteobacteria bacterium]
MKFQNCALEIFKHIMRCNQLAKNNPRVTDGRMRTDDGKELMFTQNEPTTLKKSQIRPKQTTPESSVLLSEAALKEKRPNDRQVHNDTTF